MNDLQQEPIAIIGLGCRFPGAQNPQAFWQLLCEGRSAVRRVPESRWAIDRLYDSDQAVAGKLSSCWGGFLEDIDQFDWRALRLSPREVKYMDPQHRLLLEVAWEALEDAGLPLETVAGTPTAVFQGVSSNDYFRLQTRDWTKLNGYTVTGNDLAFTANRLSYCFDLKGPSVTIAQACAASLVAVHYACQSLWFGEAEIAIAGGVNLMLSPDISIMLSKTGMLSPEGRCKTLDATANGFVRGEGAGIVVLKPLSKVSSSDRIYALIAGSAVNHNGHNEWIMAANQASQTLTMQQACARAGVLPAAIDYVELHGTGLPKGDPIEARAVGEAIGAVPDRILPCRVGAVKTNIGHLEAAAGIASLIKVALAQYHQQLPPTLNLAQVHPDIPLTSLGLVPQTQLTDWPEKAGPHLAGVTAISMAGINAHMILREFLDRPSQTPATVHRPKSTHYLLPLSAHSSAALEQYAASLKSYLSDTRSQALENLQNICYTASVRRSHHPYRLSVVGQSQQALMQALASYQDESGHCSSPSQLQPKLAFLLPDHIPSRWRLDPLCLEHYEAFQTTLEAFDQVCFQHTQWSVLHPDRPASTVSQSAAVDTAKLELMALQVALAALWQSWGITPNAYIGVGVGEIVALYLAGQLSLEEVILVALETGQAKLHHSASPSAGSGAIPDKPTAPAEEVEVTPFCPKLSESLIASGYQVFIELAPQPVLLDVIADTLQQNQQEVSLLAALESSKPAPATMLSCLSKLYVLGYTVNWQQLYSSNCQCISLPTYPWQRERLWLEWLDPTFISTDPNQMVKEGERELAVESVGRMRTNEKGKEQTIHNFPLAERRRWLEDYLIERVASLLGRCGDDLDPERPLSQQGLDSISAMELKHHVENDLNVTIPISKFLGGEKMNTIVADTVIPQIGLNERSNGSYARSSSETFDDKEWEEFKI